MLEALAAIGAVTAFAVTAWPRARTPVAPAVLVAAGLSLLTSAILLAGEGRTHRAWSLGEALALIALVFLALRRARSPWGATAAGGAAVLIIPAQASASDSALETAAGMAVWGFGALMAAAVALYLDALEARSVADARREQRLALARDLHDFVAHDVSAIVVQAQAARVVGPGEAMAALERIEEAGLHALSAMDRAVEALRDAANAPEHTVADVRALAARFQATGAVRVDVDIDDEVPSEVGGTVYRLVTEALTNVRRHAPDATRVEVRVERSRAGITVRVVNDGRAAASNGRGGSGLAALRERVEALGGTLEAGPDQHGAWRVKACFPDGR